MSELALIATGHGYENPTTPGYEPCTAFDGYEILAEPLGGFSNADRERRILGRKGDKPGTGTDYSSHVLKLAKRADDRSYKETHDLFILVQHGGGREVWRLPTMYDRGATRDALLQLPEAALYGVLYTAWSMAANARRTAMEETAHEWRKATVDGRVRRRSYPRRGIVKVWMEPERQEGETDESYKLRCRWAAPAKG